MLWLAHSMCYLKDPGKSSSISRLVSIIRGRGILVPRYFYGHQHGFFFFYKIIICILNLGFVIQPNIWQSPCCLHVFSLGKSYIYFFLHLFLNLLFSLGIFLLLPNKSNLISVHPWKPALQKPEPPFVLQCGSVKCSKGKCFSLALLIKYWY